MVIGPCITAEQDGNVTAKEEGTQRPWPEREGSDKGAVAKLFASLVLAYERETSIRFGSMCQYSLSLF